jgi:hypothetical protein
MLIVGSSTVSAGSASGALRSHSVSEICRFSTPVIAMMSPAWADGTSTRSRP